MKFLCGFLLLLTSVSCFAQKSIDLVNVYWRTSPGNSFDNIGGHKRHFNMYTANAKLPVVLGDNNVLIFGLEYQQTSITTSPSNPLYGDFKVSSSMLQIGWEHKWNKKSKMLFMAIPRLNTDFNDVDFSHFQLGALALGTTTRSEKFDWKYGIYYNGELFGHMIVPLFGFNWKINEKHTFKLLIPLNLEYAYSPKDWVKMGLRFDGVNASYRYQITPGLPATNQYIDRADNNAWAFSEFKLGANIWFHLKAGHSVLRKYRFFTPGDEMTVKLGPVNIGDDRNFNDPKSVPDWFDNGFSFETRLIYRLPLPKD